VSKIVQISSSNFANPLSVPTHLFPRLSTTTVWTILSDSQTSAGKFSDLVINAIPKTVWYKLYCYGNVWSTPTTTVHLFDYRCSFWATTTANWSDPYCAPVWNAYHYALNMWPNEYVAYSSVSAWWYWCLLDYMQAWWYWRLWIK